MDSPLSKRDFTKSRHAQRRDLFKACRTVTKGTKWRSSQGVLFAERGGWFLAAHEMTKVHVAQTFVRLCVKPMAIDPIFWDLVGEPQLRDQALSFRYFGALSAPCLIIGEFEISEEGGAAEIAARMLALVDAKLAEIAERWTVDDFLDGIRNAINPGRHFASTVTALLASGREQDALILCTEAMERRAAGGFVSKRGSFPENAVAWIRERRAA
jgi:hypothetical protein